MLKETPGVRQIPGEPRRRWFCDEYFELIVWYAPDDSLFGFQLCYDRDGHPRALTWLKDKGYKHDGIDDGDEPMTQAHKSAPILVQDGVFDAPGVLARFEKASYGLPLLARTEIIKRLKEYGARLA